MIRRLIAFLFKRKLVYYEGAYSHRLRLVRFDGDGKPYIRWAGSNCHLRISRYGSDRWHPVNFKSSEFEEKK